MINKIILLLSIFLTGSNQQLTPESLSMPVIQSGVYQSSVTSQNLPYYFITPHSEKPLAIFIYMHGAGGKYEQGMSDDVFMGNFKYLKEVLMAKNYLYVTPETTDFEKSGSQELVDLIMKLRTDYGDLPVYLSGASAGGRTVFYAIQKADAKDVRLNGIILVCPAISESNIQVFSVKSSMTPVWIEVGEDDSVMPLERAQILEEKFKSLGYLTQLESIERGNHNAPVEQMNWEKGIDFLTDNH